MGAGKGKTKRAQARAGSQGARGEQFTTQITKQFGASTYEGGAHSGGAEDVKAAFAFAMESLMSGPAKEITITVRKN